MNHDNKRCDRINSNFDTSQYESIEEFLESLDKPVCVMHRKRPDHSAVKYALMQESIHANEQIYKRLFFYFLNQSLRAQEEYLNDESEESK